MNLSPSLDRPQGRLVPAFTLIELLAATAIMSVLILAVVTITSTVLKTWSQSVDRLSINAESRTLLTSLAEDLESVVVLGDGRNWLQLRYLEAAPTVPGDQLMPQLFLVSSTTDHPDIDQNGQRIPGGICAVAYTPIFVNPFTGSGAMNTPPPPVFSVYRALVDPLNTFRGALALAPFDASTDTTLAGYWEGSAVTNTGGATPVSYYDYSGTLVNELPAWAVNRENFLSANVVGFDIILYRTVQDSTGLTQFAPIDSNPGDLLLDDPVSVIVSDQIYHVPSGTFLDGRVVFADISITVVAQEGMDILTAPGSTATFDDIVREYGTVFADRVYIEANAAVQFGRSL
jgi:hypothetical protein